jgi:hypothetical protein
MRCNGNRTVRCEACHGIREITPKNVIVCMADLLFGDQPCNENTPQ